MRLCATLAVTTALALFVAGAAQAEQKTIKDAAEYNAYITALNTQDPAAKAAAMEAFLTAYPSVVHEDALEQAMAAYQQAGDAVHVEGAARRLLAVDPNHVRALAIIVVIERQKATAASSSAQASALADQVGADAERGVHALNAWTTKPDGMEDMQFDRLKAQIEAIFVAGAAYRALQHKDYATARRYYRQALRQDPTDVQNAYQLAIADLETTPLDAAGFWWGAHAWNLASGNAAAQTAIQSYVLAKYKRFHGSDEGWQGIVTQASAPATEPPDSFAVKPRATPAEIAVQAVAENDVNSMSFSDWIFILGLRDASPANHAAADKVWAAIVAKQGSSRLQLAAKVVAVTPDGLDVALTDEGQEHNTPEMHVVLEATPGTLPAPRAMINVAGVLTGYTPQPFRFQMEKGSIRP